MASVSLLRAGSRPQLYLAFSATTAAFGVLADGLTVVSLYIPSALPRGTTSLTLRPQNAELFPVILVIY